MILIEVLQGDIDKGTWLYENEEFSIFIEKTKTIPMHDVTEIKIVEKIDEYCYIKFELGTGQTFTGRIESESYKPLYESFLFVGNQPKNQTLPLIKASIPTNKWQEEYNEETTKPNNILFLAILIIIPLILFAVFYNTKNGTNTSSWSTNQKSEICKFYIGELMKQETSTINYDETDSEGNVYVSYQKANDSTEWRYACNFTDNEVTWAVYLKDEQKWGRWRNEDTALIKYSNNDRNNVTLDILSLRKTQSQENSKPSKIIKPLSKQTKKQTNSNLADNSEFSALAQTLIIGHGYICNNLHEARQKAWDGSFYVVCDNYIRSYNIKEDVHTGEWLVTPE